MGLLDKIIGGKRARQAAEATTERLIDAISAKSMLPFVEITQTLAATLPTDSKIGGSPYTPVGFDWPLDQTEGFEPRPLAFLAQLNFSEMPFLEGFPRKGILQFYISDGEHYGLDFEQPNRQRGFRLVFHEDTKAPHSTPNVTPARLLPVTGEFRLSFKPGMMPATVSDYHFDNILLEAYNEAFPSNRVTSVDRIPDERLDRLYERLEFPYHRTGGYPTFTQLDPREYHPELKGHTTLLLQIASTETEGGAIRWGDSGTCTFLIQPEALVKQDFSNVLYYWDCN